VSFMVSTKFFYGRNTFAGNKGKVVHVHAMKADRGSRRIVPLILNLATRWR
jgi:hypothetical protein